MGEKCCRGEGIKQSGKEAKGGRDRTLKPSAAFHCRSAGRTSASCSDYADQQLTSLPHPIPSPHPFDPKLPTFPPILDSRCALGEGCNSLRMLRASMSGVQTIDHAHQRKLDKSCETHRPLISPTIQMAFQRQRPETEKRASK